MLGDHNGITPLQDMDAVASTLLKVMGRLKAGKDVPLRRTIIRRALSRILPDDRHWMEALVAGLTGDDGIEAIPAHVAALAAGWAVDEPNVARLIRNTNAQKKDIYVGRAVKGLSSAAPEFGKRLAANRIDSDEVFFRVALAHLFRRDPDSTFQMFAIDGAVRMLAKGTNYNVQGFVKKCLERFEEEDDFPDEAFPEDAWGYIAVLFDMRGRSGYIIREPVAAMRENLAVIKKGIEKELGPLSDLAFAHHAAASFVQGYLKIGRDDLFGPAVAPVLELIGHRCIVIYVREDDGGTHSDILIIPTEIPSEARKLVSNMPEVAMHDQFRQLVEINEQLHERDDIPDDA